MRSTSLIRVIYFFGLILEEEAVNLHFFEGLVQIKEDFCCLEVYFREMKKKKKMMMRMKMKVKIEIFVIFENLGQ